LWFAERRVSPALGSQGWAHLPQSSNLALIVNGHHWLQTAAAAEGGGFVVCPAWA
jgi:hypothetical protein